MLCSWFGCIQNLNESHWKEAKRNLRYIRCTINYGIHYVYSRKISFIGYMDSNGGADANVRKSTLRYMFYLVTGICFILLLVQLLS
jgi:hypothetical protein